MRIPVPRCRLRTFWANIISSTVVPWIVLQWLCHPTSELDYCTKIRQSRHIVSTATFLAELCFPRNRWYSFTKYHVNVVSLCFPSDRVERYSTLLLARVRLLNTNVCRSLLFLRFMCCLQQVCDTKRAATPKLIVKVLTHAVSII